MAFRLFIARGNSQGHQFIAVQPMVFIGRDPNCDVVLSDAGVSARHVRITERDGHYFAEDLKSANGTTLNGHSLGHESEIFTGDSLGMGTAVVQLTLLEVPDITARKRLVPSGVSVSANRDTGESRPLPRPKRAGDEEEATLPAGTPLSRDELKSLPIDRSKYDGDTDKTSPVAPVMADPFLFPKVSPPLGAGGSGPVPRMVDPVAPTQQASVLASALPDAFSDTSGTVRDLGVMPERERETGEKVPEPVSRGPGGPKTGEKLPEPVSRGPGGPKTGERVPERERVSLGGAGSKTGERVHERLSLSGVRREKDTARQPPSFDELREKATAMVPGLPPAAEAMTAIDAGVVEAPPQPPTRIVNAVADPHSPPSVLVSASDVLRRAPDAANLETRVREPTVMAGESTDPQARARELMPDGERASERARRRRQAKATLGGQLNWYWGELPFQARAIITGVGGVLGLALLTGMWLVFRPAPRADLPPEPVVLTGRPIPFSFGVGDGVDFEHVDFKELRFDIAAPTAVAVVVHYRAADIAHEEVAVSVNGNESGFVPADMGMPDREIETLLSQFVLKRDEPNVLVFDNVKNPPAKDRWRVSDLYMELIPVPEVSAEHAMQNAKDAYAKAELLEKQRTTGDDTLFLIWRTYRHGWISLLSLREDKRGWMFAEMKHKAETARTELDRLCGTLMLDAKKQMELKNPEGAKEILEGVGRFFPTKDHACPALAEQKLREYDL